MLKLEGACRAAFRICSRNPSVISTGSKALTALRHKIAVRISLATLFMLLLQHRRVAYATYTKTGRKDYRAIKVLVCITGDSEVTVVTRTAIDTPCYNRCKCPAHHS